MSVRFAVGGKPKTLYLNIVLHPLSGERIRFYLVRSDGYYVAYKPITLSCILFMFIEMKFIHCHSCVMFAMKSMSMCNDYVNYDEIII